MKSQKGFDVIDINGKKFLFSWANRVGGPMLIMYNENDRKIEIPHNIWHAFPHSDEYKSKEPTWRGPEWGDWGKPEAKEMYFKYIKYVEIYSVMAC